MSICISSSKRSRFNVPEPTRVSSAHTARNIQVTGQHGSSSNMRMYCWKTSPGMWPISVLIASAGFTPP